MRYSPRDRISVFDLLELAVLVQVCGKTLDYEDGNTKHRRPSVIKVQNLDQNRLRIKSAVKGTNEIL